jgi:hypothetical protein
MSATNRKVRHIVLVKFREDAAEEVRGELIRLSQWSREADYVTNYVCGWSVENNPYPGQEWDWGMSLDMTEADVERYAADPTHAAIPDEVLACAEQFAVLDFVIE